MYDVLCEKWSKVSSTLYSQEVEHSKSWEWNRPGISARICINNHSQKHTICTIWLLWQRHFCFMCHCYFLTGNPACVRLNNGRIIRDSNGHTLNVTDIHREERTCSAEAYLSDKFIMFSACFLNFQTSATTPGSVSRRACKKNATEITGLGVECTYII